YCLSVALRLWKNRRRKYAWRQRISGTQDLMSLDTDLLNAAPAESPEEQLLHGEQKRLIRKAVDELPQRLRTIVLLFYMEDQSIDQIARITGIPTGTVKSRLHHARKALRQKLKEFWG
ncbi:MAG: sigma-70 family RNA polymerase sigma factor, partial [Acetatifactor sp.]|nr:sigma-70 family RNA polymerase sigma factor [Acetatifactor sp.]